MPKQAVTVELYYDAAWHDLVATNDVFADTPIVITRGQGDEGAALRPCSITLRLANDDDRYRPSNPQSPLYGKAGVNTPLRVSVAGVVRGVAEASSWAADQTTDFRPSPARGAAWVDVQAGGLLQRVNNWSEPIRSALYRFVALSGVTPAEWWPMEDASGSSSAVSAVGGSPMAPVTTVRYTLPDGTPIPPGGAPDFARGNGIPGSDALPSFQGGGTLAADVRPGGYNGYAVDWMMQFQAGTDEGGTTSADVLHWTENGTYVSFTVNVVKNNVTVFYSTAADLATLTFTGSASAAFDVYDGAPHHYRFQVRQSGGSYLAQLLVDSAVVATAVNFAGGMAGTVGQPDEIDWNPGEAKGDYMPIAAGHLIIWRSGQIGGQPAVFQALTGYNGERASYRLARLMTEEGVPYFVSASYDQSMPMGPQRPDTPSNLLREIADTEDGLIFDNRPDLHLYFLSRFDRYNQTPALTLDAAANPSGMPSLPTEVTDDLPIHNIVTASQRDGGDVTVTDSTSPMGTQDPPNGRGEYKQTVNVNLYDPADVLPQEASWWLYRGTVNQARYPQVTVDLTTLSAARIAAIEAVDVGSVIDIVNYRENTLRLYVLGYTETIGTHTRMITFTCAPDEILGTAAVLDTVVLDSATTTLKAGISASTTAATFTTSDVRDVWSTSATPFDVMISGERCTVTSIGAASLVSGSYDQAATLKRSVNGIVKSLGAGEPVHLAGTYGRLAL